jgi:hypothetical protein
MHLELNLDLIQLDLGSKQDKVDIKSVLVLLSIMHIKQKKSRF